MTHQYSRAERLLTRPFSTSPSPNLQTKGKSRETETHYRLPVGPSGMLQVPEHLQEGVSRLVDMSIQCRNLAALCQIRQGNWEEATELLGESNPFRDSGRSGPSVPNLDGGIKAS
jgi:anaphase-promoting complex subunit 6